MSGMSFACVRVIWTAQTRCDVNRRTGLSLLFAAAIASASLALEVAAKPTNQGNSQGSGSRANKGNGHGSPSNCAAISSPASGASVRPREPRANSANRSGRHGRSTSLAPSDCDALANASASSATGPASGSQSGNGQGNNGNAQGNGGQSGNGNGQGGGSQANNGNGQGSGSQGNGGSGAGSPPPAPAPAYCSASDPHPWSLAVGNVTVGGSAAANCWGVVTKNNWPDQTNPFGNDSAGTINLNGLFGSDDWSLVVRDPSDSGSPSPGSFGGVTWTLTGNGNGTWSLEASDSPPGQIEVDFIAVLKGSDSWAGWFFDDFTFSVPSTTDGLWTIAWNNNGGQTAGFSHMSLYMREARFSPPPSNPACAEQACSSTVPEPGTLALIAFGAWGIGALRGRRKPLEPKRVGA